MNPQETFKPFYTSYEAEDGTWWYRCPNCDHNIGIPRMINLNIGESTPEEKRNRVAPNIQFSFKVVCQKCETEMRLQRYEINIEIPKENI